MNQRIRNIVIFGVVTFGCGFLGHAINTQYGPPDPMQSLGVLIWLVSPLAANLLLRLLGGDGWKDFGIAPNLKSGWRWYLAALLIVPAISLITSVLGAFFGGVETSGFSIQGMRAFFSLLGVGFVGSMVKNLFEEFSWRGYLTPRLEALQPNPFINAVITGIIWAGWHIPYYLYFLSPDVLKEQTSLSVPALILTSFIILPLQAFAYGELRLLSKSVWPAWLLHNIANGISYALVMGGFVLLSGSFLSLVFSPTTAGLAYALLMGTIGWGLYQYRIRLTKAGQS